VPRGISLQLVRLKALACSCCPNMRLIDVETLRLRTFVGENIPKYAILSHTWGPEVEEVSFQDILTGNLEGLGNGTHKLKGCCLQAKRDGLGYVWIDTCCINKDSSTELGEAINSMFRWYKKAAVCYAFLADVGSDDDCREAASGFFASRWFRRGWTLQELLAPESLHFYNSGWGSIGPKEDYSHEVEVITGIPHQFLLGWDDFRQASVAQRMSWAACRETTRTEDMAYCLLGIFDITMPMIYGEGSRSLRRLQHEIIRHTRDHSILAWGLGLAGPDPSNPPTDILSAGALATTPAEFAKCGAVVPRKLSTGAAIDFELVAGGCLSVHLSLYTAPTGNLYGLLSCGPEDSPGQVVGIPLRKATIAETAPDEYVRPQSHCPVLVEIPTSDREWRPIRLQMGRQSQMRQAASRRCWLYVDGHKKINLKLENVWPPVRWEKGRAMIAEATDMDGAVPQRCLVRFRAGGEEVRDLIVMLGFTAGQPQAQARQNQYHVMSFSRGISLQDILDKIVYLDQRTFGKRVASIGKLHVQVALETRLVAQEPVFVMRLAQVFSPPEIAMDADKELQRVRNKIRLVRILQETDEALRAGKQLLEESSEKRAALTHMTSQLRDVQQQLEQLQKEQKKLSDERDRLYTESEKAHRALQQAEGRVAALSSEKRNLQLGIEEMESKENRSSWLDKLIRIQLATGDLDLGPGNEELFSQSSKDGGKIEAMSPLSWAAITGREAIIEMLLNEGTDLEAKIAGGWTPLLLAASSGHYGIVERLLEKGADPRVKNDNGATALQCAVDKKHENIVKLLIASHNVQQPSLMVTRPTKTAVTTLHTPEITSEHIAHVTLEGADAATLKETDEGYAHPMCCPDDSDHSDSDDGSQKASKGNIGPAYRDDSGTDSGEGFGISEDESSELDEDGFSEPDDIKDNPEYVMCFLLFLFPSLSLFQATNTCEPKARRLGDCCHGRHWSWKEPVHFVLQQKGQGRTQANIKYVVSFHLFIYLGP